MITRGATFVSRLAVFLSVLFVFTACGGGGGGDTFYDGEGGGGGGGNSDISFKMFDPAGNETDTVTSSGINKLEAKVRGAGEGVVVNASTTIGTLLPESGTALTNGDGVATFQVAAGEERGAGTITATATRDGGTVTGTFNFQVGDSGLRIGYFDTDGMFIENQIGIQPQESLAVGGNAQLTVAIVDEDGNLVQTSEQVRFSSGCIAAGLAGLNPENPINSANGRASSTYTAAGCSGVDQVTASVVGASAQASGSITIAAPSANTVEFVSADPTLIVLKGTGGQNRDETSDVIFRATDSTGAPLAGVTINFALTTEVGGLALSRNSGLTNGLGEVLVTVQAGDVATSVRVEASIDDGKGGTVATVSDLITVTTGLPDQNSISLSIEDSFVVDGAFNTDGLTRTVTVAMADKFNNPVVDGTAAVFTTEYGSIESTCFTVDGNCSVEWRSQEPRLPLLSNDDYVVSVFDNQGKDCSAHNGANAIPCPHDLGFIRGGRSTISVTAIGEESFIDRNGNGIMDQDESALFDNKPEAFLDTNEDGVYTPEVPACKSSPMGSLACISGREDLFTDFNSNEAYDFNDDPAVYNGLLCPVEGDGVWCSRKLIHVRDDHVITLGDGPNYYIYLVGPGGSVTGSVSANVVYTVFIADTFNNPPPAGATVSLATEGDCDIIGADSTDVFNQAGSGSFVWPTDIKVSVEPSAEPDPSFFLVTLSAPTVDITWSFDCNVPVVEPEGG